MLNYFKFGKLAVLFIQKHIFGVVEIGGEDYFVEYEQ
jgi:hypothetical protein